MKTKIFIALFGLISTFTVAQPTELDYGDLAIVAVNAMNNGCIGDAGEDEISFFCFKDITNGTTIDMTDNGWERTNANLWGNTEGAIRIQRSGGTIPAGTVITIRNNNGVITGVYPDANWTYTNQNPAGAGWNSLNLNSSGDQLYMMQGGTWNAGTVSGHNAVYSSGKILYGFSTNSTWSSFQNSSQHSGLFPSMACFSMAPSATSDYNKYTGPTTATTQRNWLNRIGNPLNWTSYSTCAQYYSTGPNYGAGVTYGITPGGFRSGWWYGINQAWMQCTNWEDLRVPDEFTDVTINENNPTDGPFAQPWINTPGAVCRSIEINVGASLLMSGATSTFSIYENIKKNGVFSHTSGWLSLVGNVNTVLTGSSFIAFQNVIFNKTGGAGVFADTLLVVKGNSTYTSGIVTHAADSYVQYNPTATQPVGVSNNSHVDGKVVRIGVANFVFPTGNAGKYQPISISGLSSSSTFEAQFFDTSGPAIYGNALGAGIDHVATCNHWTLNRIQGTSPARVNLSWGNDPDCTVDNLPDLVVARWNNTDWQNHGQLSTTGNTVAGSVNSFDLINNFSPFVLASVSILNPLPVEWLSFTATAITEKSVLLEWQTATETNNDFFVVEHSADGNEFKEIGRISGAGFSTSISDYDFTHHNAPAGSNYYRLRQVDFNGDNDLSSVRHVLLKGNSQIINAFIASDNLEINLSTSAQNCKVKMHDLTGRILLNSQLGSGTRHIINLATLSTGIYLVTVETEETSFSTKVVR